MSVENIFRTSEGVVPWRYIGDHMGTSSGRPWDVILPSGYTTNWSENVFVIKKVENTVPWTYVIDDLKEEEIVRTFYKKELQKTNQKVFRTEKVIKSKGDKLYGKWKGYNNSFNSWIDKKNI